MNSPRLIRLGLLSSFLGGCLLSAQTGSEYDLSAKTKMNLRDFDGAVTDWTRAIEIEPDEPVWYANRGLARTNTGDFDGALADYDRAIKLDPKQDSFYSNRSVARMKKGDLDGAIADCDRALALKPNEPYTFSNRGKARQAKGDLNGAIADYSRAITIEPNVAFRYKNRGRAEQANGDLDGALADCDHAIALAPNESSHYENRGVVRQARGDFEGAIADFDKAIELARDEAAYPRCHRALILSRLHRGHNDPVVALMRVVSSWKNTWLQAVGLYLVGLLPEANFLAKAAEGGATKAREQQCEAFYFAGMNRLLAGDVAAARDFFGKCVATKAPDVNEVALARAELARLAETR